MRHVPVESGGGVVEQAVPVDQQTTPCLSDDEIKALVTLARQTESHYGCAQDMEWAIAHGDKRIYLLQSRPETIWSNKEVRRISTPKKKAFEHVFSALGGKQDP